MWYVDSSRSESNEDEIQYIKIVNGEKGFESIHIISRVSFRRYNSESNEEEISIKIDSY